MSKTIGKFDYAVVKADDDEGAMPFHPFVVVTLKRRGAQSQDVAPVVSEQQLMTDQEIDHHIAALKEDLNAVGTRAKRALREAKSKMVAIARARNSS